MDGVGVAKYVLYHVEKIQKDLPPINNKEFNKKIKKSLVNKSKYNFNNDLIKKLEDNNLIAFKYCDNKGKIEKESNPNGSSNNIAGILNENKNILGMMPHPERLIDPLLSGEDGSLLFTSLLKS